MADDDALPGRPGNSNGGSRGRDGKSSAALDAHAARVKYLGPEAAAGGAAGGDSGSGGAGGGGGGGGENSVRAGKSKAQWGWGAGKSLFGKKVLVGDTGKKSGAEHERGDAPSGSSMVGGIAGGFALSVGEYNSTSRERSAGAGAGASESVNVARSRDSLDLPQRKTSDGSRAITDSKMSADGKRQQGGRQQQQQQPSSEKDKGRGSRVAADQRPSSGLWPQGGGGGGRGGDAASSTTGGGGGGPAVVRVRDSTKVRQGRSVESPARMERGASDAAAAVAAAHGFFSVPAALYPDSSIARDGGSKQRQKEGSEEAASPWEGGVGRARGRAGGVEQRRSGPGSGTSTTGHASSYARVREQRMYGDIPVNQIDDFFDFNRRRRGSRVVEVGTRGERVSSTRPSSRSDGGGGGGHTRTRSEDRMESGERSRRSPTHGQQWSDLTSGSRPPLPHPNSGAEANAPSAGGGGGAKITRGGSGRAAAASPANSNTTSDDYVAPGRVGTDEGTPSTVGWGASSLAGWGESMAAEAEAEVLGPRQQRGGGGGGTGGRGGESCSCLGGVDGRSGYQ